MKRLGPVFGAAALVIAAITIPAVATAPPAPAGGEIDTGAASYPNCRFGVGQVRQSVLSYNLASLNAGWYLNWKTMTYPPRPGGAEFAQVIRVTGATYSPAGAALANLIAANPGSLWLIGNEPDRPLVQDDTLPQDYAVAYHDAYAFIKARDPTAQVAAGGIVQPTPLRLQYLDIVLDTYAARYNEPLPTDAWSIHAFMLREASCAAYPDGCWGAEIPPGITATVGVSTPLDLDNTDNLALFQERIIQFRQWMQRRGYRNTPLLITEYGTLLPYYDPDGLYYDSQGRPFDEARAIDFLRGTFDFMRMASNPALGYPADENRLVQRWLWYSLDDLAYGGALFDPYNPHVRMALGNAFADYTGALPPTVDLFAVEVGQVGPPPFSPAGAVTLTLRARFSNVGNIALTQPVTIRFLDGAGNLIAPDQVISAPLAGCAGVRDVYVTWPNVPPGAHTVRVILDPSNTISEANENNNQARGTVLVATRQSFMPFVSRWK